MLIYYVLIADYNLYMDAQQRINLEIYQQFQQEGIEFAYPTQSLYVHNKTVVGPPIRRKTVCTVNKINA
ncbi:hypothetical protein JCM12294_29260 [Desulfocicer niacini]